MNFWQRCVALKCRSKLNDGGIQGHWMPIAFAQTKRPQMSCKCSLRPGSTCSYPRNICGQSADCLYTGTGWAGGDAACTLCYRCHGKVGEYALLSFLAPRTAFPKSCGWFVSSKIEVRLQGQAVMRWRRTCFTTELEDERWRRWVWGRRLPSLS